VKSDEVPSTPKRQKVGVNDTAMNTSPAMNTRSQLALSKEVGEGTSQDLITTTPIKQKRAVKKKLTPRKANN
jgi:hypothetical protein